MNNIAAFLVFGLFLVLILYFERINNSLGITITSTCLLVIVSIFSLFYSEFCVFCTLVIAALSIFISKWFNFGFAVIIVQMILKNSPGLWMDFQVLLFIMIFTIAFNLKAYEKHDAVLFIMLGFLGVLEGHFESMYWMLSSVLFFSVFVYLFKRLGIQHAFLQLFTTLRLLFLRVIHPNETYGTIRIQKNTMSLSIVYLIVFFLFTIFCLIA